ncbi:G-type lectin S-receptor-like serine/threonine-protein kinase SD2-5 [Pistacia vera]|uniref:G-type lectin S-receptor-like serine/threonine-protein kinase SD2-5 n=1 Tax=Pistacia vera TaxID=55513 RepID=UPI001263652A|nr:G-type lectin S-receptor-like serine/threonine-protein kinase SD2-5 [Pistacia vera]
MVDTSLSGKWSFACGFRSSSDPDCNTYLFGIFALNEESTPPKLVWSSNRNKPVRNKATLLLSRDGDLMLQDFDGTLVWSTNTKGRSVAGLKLTESGNLVLFDTNNSIVWQSFDHPTDTLLIGQKLYSNSSQKLTASTSQTNYSEGGLYSLFFTIIGLSAFMESVYPYTAIESEALYDMQPYVILLNGSLVLFSYLSGEPVRIISLPNTTPLQHVTLDYDGHFRAYDLVEDNWRSVADIFIMDSCDYPLVCGRYGLCSKSGEDDPACTCPQPDDTKLSYFRPIDDRHPNRGCSEVNSLSCDKFKYQKMVELKNVSHLKGLVHTENTDVESCKLDCLKNCSCKAAMLDSVGTCYLESQIFSLKNVEPGKEADTFRFFLKVQNDSNVLMDIEGKKGKRVTILGWSLGVFSGLLLIIGIIYIAFSAKKKDGDDLEEEYLKEVPGMPKRYSYEDLITTTDNFSKKLGQGGFGSVFEGTLNDGTIVAVKCLEGLSQIKESFLSEVKTIGSIHHVNLVRLIGYSTNRSHRLLVYEAMCNGSLDKWIFHINQRSALDWRTRRMIILDIAKGLAYLHEGCRQKIFHLDIKPQNILLDENFHAKVSDFGLSKLIDRDQSHVVTRMKGTPGYLAPEWLSSVITEKVDVYSFGVVVLEILCGRKNLDRSQPEEDMHLLSVLKRKAEEDQLLDMIDKKSEDMISNGAEVLEMMKVAAWCLQSEFSKRPSMSVVVKVLEGAVDVEENLEYDFSVPATARASVIPGPKNGAADVATPMLPSTLSGPR